MLTENYIKRQKPSRMSLNFSQLREAGIARLQELAGTVWTDYNVHDPGVTILEALCYAITDLSYRCNFEIQDLLASDPANRVGNSPDFYEAHQILPTQPVTINDFRKILIDLPFVKNAWLEPSNKNTLPVFYDEIKKCLVYDALNSNGKQNTAINIRGLYNVWLEFANDPEVGNLNSEVLTFGFEITDGALKIPATALFYFPAFDDLPGLWKSGLTITGIDLTLKTSTNNSFDFEAKAGINQENGDKEIIHFHVAVDTDGYDWLSKKTQVKSKISGYLKDISENGLFPAFNRKQMLIASLLEDVKAVLNQNRNLCEDFESISLIRREEISLEGEIGISLGSDTNQVLAEAFYQIQQFLNPSIRFYTLQQLLAEGLSTEEIFEGPLLKHGFIKDDSLKAFRQCKTLFVSDVFNVFMSSNPDAIKYITNFRLSSFLNNVLQEKNADNLLKLNSSNEFRPVVSIKKSNIHVKKGDVYQHVDWKKVESLFNEKMLAGEPDKSNETSSRIETPAGRDRKTGNYFSFQHDFPPVYGIGNSGLSEKSTAERIAQARQLKGYLMFFDQLFANFLAQVSNLKNIFSIDGNVSQTYFEQAVYQVPGALYLLKPFVDGQSDLSDKEALAAAWKLFVENQGNDYMTATRSMNETENEFTDRRNRFLDHLMARFNEQFADYSLLMFAKSDPQAYQKLIADKAAFLQELPVLGAERAKSFTTSKPPLGLWDTTNVTGLEKRVSRMLGFSDYRRRFLAKGPFGNIEFYQETDTDIVNEYRFRIIGDDNKILLSSHKHYHVTNHGYGIVYRVLEKGKNQANYQIHKAVDGQFYYHLYDDEGHIIARRIDLFATEDEAKAEIEKTTDFINTRFVGLNDEPEEGFYVVENLLLRPKFNEKVDGVTITDPLLPEIHDDFDNLTVEGMDPYSFRITAIFPAELKKFSDENFRALAETTLRLETPAHIMPQVFFVNNLQLSRFERAYKPWLEINALPVPEEPFQKLAHLKKLNQALFQLIGALQFIPQEPDL